MGLDMFISLEVEDAKEYPRPVDKTFGTLTSVNTEYEFWYFRKANHIHQWFVDNVQDGVDECQKFVLQKEHIEQLLDVCEQVNDDHSLAPELLPTTHGFFFGSVDYDDYYANAVKSCIEMCKKMLPLFDGETIKSRFNLGKWGKFRFTYQSSW